MSNDFIYISLETEGAESRVRRGGESRGKEFASSPLSFPSLLFSRLFLTGSYDNKLRVFSSSQTLLHTINTGALSGGITSISWLPSSSTPSDDWLASGNMDGITRVFSLPTISSDTLPSTTPSSTSLLSLHHHNGPVSSIQASKNPSSSKSLLTAGWDGTIALFPLRERTKHDKSVPEPLQTSKLQTKRRKLDKGLMAEQEKEREEGLVETTGWRVGPEAVFRGHKGRVGRAIWDKTPGGEEQKIWSCGWDGSVRGWDVETQVNFLIKVSLFFDASISRGTLPFRSPLEKEC